MKSVFVTTLDYRNEKNSVVSLRKESA